MRLNFCRPVRLVIVVGLTVAACLAQAGEPGEQVVLVYNKLVPESKGVADYYAERRHVPSNQIFGFELSTNEEMSRLEFRNQLQRPLATALQNEKLWRITSQSVPAASNQPARMEWRVSQSKVRYLVLCYGVPIRIEKMPQFREPATEHFRPELRRDEAAVDSELALLPCVEQDLPLAGPLRNPLYGVTNEAWFHPTNSVIIVARLDGPTAGIARGLVDKAIQAEKEGLWGRAYFDLRNTTDPALKSGDEWIRGAAELCRHLGFGTVVDENVATFPAGFPMSHIGFYIGWYDENVSGPFTQPNVEFMPGAFAYHLHSFSAANLRGTTRNWVGPLLAKGATITLGCVNEPYLSGTPDLVTFMARFVYHQYDFGAAAYAAQSVLSWQTTVVGDPLYRPFGRVPEQVHEELERNHSPMLPWSYLRLVNLNLANGKPPADSIAFLEELTLTKKSAILCEKLADLYSLQGKPASATHTYAQALKLDPSPQQSIRLYLVLGEKLAGLERPAEAYENYQQLLRSFPEYPDKVSIYKRLLPLAQALNKKEEVEKLKAQISQL
jgi:uncharacterized protein (TIGR03790 family)